MKTPRSTVLASLISALAAVAAQAQSVPSPATPAPGMDQVVTLQAFEVTSDVAHGYVATESLTGTRVATRIQDLPFNVNVITSDFINDFGLFDLNDQLAFVSGASPSEVPGQFQLRGFPSPVTLVDGFRQQNLVDILDISREEVIKGTAASIYGAVPPGGALNIITVQPSVTPTAGLEAGGGSDSFMRASLFSSGPVGPSNTVFYYVGFSDMTQKYEQDFASKHNTDVLAKLLFKPNPDTSFTLSFSHHELYAHPFVQVLTVTEKQLMPWAGDGITESQYYGLETADKSLLNYDYEGPESFLHNRNTTLTGVLERRITDWFSIRYGANLFMNPYNDEEIGSGAYYPYGTGNITETNGVITNAFTPEVKDQPQADFNNQRGASMQLDNLFSFDTGPVKNKLLVTADYFEQAQRFLTLNATANGGEATDYYDVYSPYSAAGAPFYTPQTTWSPSLLGYGWNTTLYQNNPSVYQDITTDQWVAASDYGAFASEQASMFDDRLVLMAGGRWDYVRNQVANYAIAAPGATAYSIGGALPNPYQGFDYNTADWTYQIGGTLAVVNGLNLYANKSTGFNPQPQIDTDTGQALQNNTSEGVEYGIKGTLFDQRLTFTADHFLINEYNLAQTETDPVTNVKDTILAGHEQSKGYELDAQFAATNNLYFQVDYGYTQATVLDAAPLTFYDGLPVRRVPRNNWGAVVHYQFSSGLLRGIFVEGSFNYYSKSLVNLGSGKVLIPGPVATKTNSTLSLWTVPGTDYTYIGTTAPAGGVKGPNGVTPFYNVPFPGSGALPYPDQPASAFIDYPVTTSGAPLPLATGVTAPAGDTVYVGTPSGVYVDDGREDIYNAPYAVFGFGTGYGWKSGRFTNKVQVNIHNLFDRIYTYGSGVPGIPFTVEATYSIGY